MTKFFPALAHTDSIGYFDAEGNRKVMSVRPLLSEKFSSNFLISLSFDETIHYEKSGDIGDHNSVIKLSEDIIETVFVDCGAFHYFDESSPRFKRGGFVTSKSAFDEYMLRHVDKNPKVKYLLCSPDHIIGNFMSDIEFEKRKHFIISSAKSFLKRVQGKSNITPIAVVHGRTKKERYNMAKELIEIGYEYLAFGGLVPVARNQAHVLEQIAGISDLNNPVIDPESAIGIAKKSDCKIHIFGLNSPEWYRWWRRMRITSFDGSKLSQEGAANGIIWKYEIKSMEPVSSKDLYTRMKIKDIKSRIWQLEDGIYKLKTSEDGFLDLNHKGWKYLQTASCTSNRCPHRKNKHNCDPRVTGSIEHNMGRMIINAYSFEKIMKNIDELCDVSNYKINDSRYDNWRKIVIR